MVNVQIMDTAGQERFKSINTSYYRKADCCLLVYDISQRSSFEDIKNYFIEKIKEKCKKDVQVILLGNKTDLEDKREVPSEEGGKLGLNNDYIFLETSCLKNTNVSDAFETLIEITNREMIKNKKKNNNGAQSNNIIISSSQTNSNGNNNPNSCRC